MQQNAEPPEWELVDEVGVRLRDFYPTDVPLKRLVQYSPPGNVISIYTKNLRYQRYLPKTAFDENSRVKSFFSPDGVITEDETMRITENTGWRDYSFAPLVSLNLNSYHYGLDIAAKKNVTTLGKNLYAPEDGWLYFTDSEITSVLTLPDASKIRIASDFGETDTSSSSTTYHYSSFGIIGVFVTNPRNVQDGRVYLFAHMGTNGQSRGQALASLKNIYNSFSYYAGKPFPQGETNAIYVNKGQWIGQVGNNGIGSASHAHAEVFEYYQKDSSGNELGKWRRVDLLSILDPAYYSTDYNLTDVSGAAFSDSSYLVENELKKAIVTQAGIAESEAKKRVKDYFHEWCYGK